MSQRPRLPFTSAEELGLESTARPGYEVTQESRFDADPDAPHLPSCSCAKCVDAQRCAKCGKRGGVIDCSTCRILAMPPRERGANPYPDNDGTENHIPIRGEGYLGPLRYNGQRSGDPVRTTPTCVVCGCVEREKLWQRHDKWECIRHEGERVAESRLRLVKAPPPSLLPWGEEDES